MHEEGPPGGLLARLVAIAQRGRLRLKRAGACRIEPEDAPGLEGHGGTRLGRHRDHLQLPVGTGNDPVACAVPGDASAQPLAQFGREDLARKARHQFIGDLENARRGLMEPERTPAPRHLPRGAPGGLQRRGRLGRRGRARGAGAGQRR